MTTFFYFLAVSSLGMWLGAIVFFSFLAAPKIFGALGRTEGGSITTLVFPRYYRFGVVCGAVALVAALFGGFPLTSWTWTLVLLLVGGLVGLNLHTDLILRPELEQLWETIKDDEKQENPDLAPQRKRFGKLHGQSMGANLVVAIGIAIALYLLSSAITVAA